MKASDHAIQRLATILAVRASMVEAVKHSLILRSRGKKADFLVDAVWIDDNRYACDAEQLKAALDTIKASGICLVQVKEGSDFMLLIVEFFEKSPCKLVVFEISQYLIGDDIRETFQAKKTLVPKGPTIAA